MSVDLMNAVEIETGIINFEKTFGIGCCTFSIIFLNYDPLEFTHITTYFQVYSNSVFTKITFYLNYFL